MLINKIFNILLNQFKSIGKSTCDIKLNYLEVYNDIQI